MVKKFMWILALVFVTQMVNAMEIDSSYYESQYAQQQSQMQDDVLLKRLDKLIELEEKNNQLLTRVLKKDAFESMN